MQFLASFMLVTLCSVNVNVVQSLSCYSCKYPHDSANMLDSESCVDISKSTTNKKQCGTTQVWCSAAFQTIPDPSGKGEMVAVLRDCDVEGTEGCHDAPQYIPGSNLHIPIGTSILDATSKILGGAKKTTMCFCKSDNCNDLSAASAKGGSAASPSGGSAGPAGVSGNVGSIQRQSLNPVFLMALFAVVVFTRHAIAYRE